MAREYSIDIQGKGTFHFTTVETVDRRVRDTTASSYFAYGPFEIKKLGDKVLDFFTEVGNAWRSNVQNGTYTYTIANTSHVIKFQIVQTYTLIISLDNDTIVLFSQNFVNSTYKSQLSDFLFLAIEKIISTSGTEVTDYPLNSRSGYENLPPYIGNLYVSRLYTANMTGYPNTPSYVENNLVSIVSQQKTYWQGSIYPWSSNAQSDQVADALKTTVSKEITAWPGPSSGTGGAGGDFDDTSDAISVPSLPSVQVAATGNFLTMFNPTLAELEQVGDLMFSQGFFNVIKNLFADPINAIISLHLTPFPLTVEETKKEWVIGLLNTEIAMNRITDQFIQFDFGTLDLNEYWGNTLDYSPYTKAEIYLPYIGSRALNIDDIMQSTIGLKYNVDLLSGTITAYISVTKHDPRSPMDEQETVMYQFSGNCNTQIPVSGADYSGLVRNVITLAGIVGTGFATGALGAAGEGALIAEGTGKAMLGAATAMAVNGSKPDILHSGSAGSVAGALGVQSAYITLTRPAQSLPENYAEQFGYPSNIKATLGDLSGYTVVNSVHVGIAGATADELAEIERLLKSGVIL